MKNYIYISILFLLCYSCNPTASETKITDVYAISDGENGLARQEYELARLKSPLTNEIPSDIQQREFEFVSGMDQHKATDLFDWQSKGPVNVGGRTRAIALDVTNENRILAGGVSGGLWISENGGQSFTKATTNLMLHSVTSIAQDTRQGFENIWYYGTGELSGNSSDLFGHGIYKSIDNGLTWDLLPATFNDSSNIVSNEGDFQFVSDVLVNPTNGDIIVASYTGIFISQDGGDTWTNQLLADASPNGFGYYNFGNQISVTCDDNGVFYACLSSDVADAGIWRSTDGLSWTDITPNGFPSSFRRVEGTVNPFNVAEQLFIVDASINPSVDNHELWHYTYLSGDGSGANGTWENRTANLPAGDCLGFYDFNFGYFQSQNSYDMCIAYHPTQQDVVFLGGTNLYRSTDAFQSTTNYTWVGGYQCDAVNPSNYIWPNHHPDNHAVLFLPSDSKKMISAHDGGLSITSDCLANTIYWESMNNGYGTSQFYTVAIEQGNTNSETIIGGLQDNGTWLTTSSDPNQAWLSTFYGDGAYCAIAENATNYYVSWQGGKTFKFDIGSNGQTNSLTRIDPIGGQDYMFINPFILDPTDNNTMYLPAGRYIWKNDSLSDIPMLNDEYNAIDLGWTKILESYVGNSFGTINYITAIDMSQSNSDELYYGTYNGLVFKLSGLSTGPIVKENLKRTNMPSNAYVSCVEVNPNDENEVLISYSNYEVKSIFHTTDGGQNWTNISGSLEENPDGSGAGPSVNWMHFYQDAVDSVILAGTTSGLFATQELNAENTIWQREGDNQIGNVPVTMITSRTFDKNIVVATHGGGIFSTKVVDVGVNDLQEISNIQVGFPVPNPSKGNCRLSFQLEQDAQLSIAVYNLLGLKIDQVESSTFSLGTHEVKWSTSSYPVGVYFVSVTNGESRVTRKLKVLN